MMTDEQVQEIKRHSQRNNQNESWYKIFQILFPDAQRPVSPYVTSGDPAIVQQFVMFFRQFGPEELFGPWRDRRERSGETVQFEASTQAIVDEAFEIALPDYVE
jgi:hypothetical protein